MWSSYEFILCVIDASVRVPTVLDAIGWAAGRASGL